MMIEFFEPGDQFGTMSVDGKATLWKVQHNGAVEPTPWKDQIPATYADVKRSLEEKEQG